MHKMPYVLNSIISQLFSEHIYRVLALIAAMGLMLVSNGAFAADPNPFESSPTSDLASCPVNHKMYYIGANAPTPNKDYPVTSQPLDWTAGSDNRTFTFTEGSDKKEFVIYFPLLLDLNTNYGGTPPFFGSINGATTSALNLVHNSPSIKNNHSLNVSINRSVSKVGYKIQDLDSTISSRQVPYIEEVDVSANRGQLTFNTSFHTRDPAGNVVTARSGLNCGVGGCTIDAAWNYSIANTTLNLKHNNTLTQTNSPHAIGYSDFYFCLAPPKLIVKKALTGTRFNDSDTKRDQFNIKVAGGKLTPDSQGSTASFTTTGAGSTITNGSTVTPLELAPSTTYTISENIINGDATNYNTSYVCSNATTGSNSSTPSGNTSSFALSNLNYGDEVTCIITNTPKSYNFSGTVFDDNGGITAADATKQNITSTFIGNSAYFNGILDSNESGIFDSGLQVTLTNCSGVRVDTSSANPQTVSSSGKYNFVVQSGALPARVCLVETEPTSWSYSVDTTANTREVTLTNNTYIYNNLDFGEVKADNTALVLIKYQYVHECNSSLNYTSITNTSDPSTGFSTSAPSSNVIPGKCIAYKIEAYNRGHISLTDIQISDVLQNVKVKSEFHLPKALGVPPSTFQSTNQTGSIGQNETIISDKFTLSNTVSSTTTSKATLYFNTKYGTTVNP